MLGVNFDVNFLKLKLRRSRRWFFLSSVGVGDVEADFGVEVEVDVDFGVEVDVDFDVEVEADVDFGVEVTLRLTVSSKCRSTRR